MLDQQVLTYARMHEQRAPHFCTLQVAYVHAPCQAHENALRQARIPLGPHISIHIHAELSTSHGRTTQPDTHLAPAVAVRPDDGRRGRRQAQEGEGSQRDAPLGSRLALLRRRRRRHLPGLACGRALASPRPVGPASPTKPVGVWGGGGKAVRLACMGLDFALLNHDRSACRMQRSDWGSTHRLTPGWPLRALSEPPRAGQISGLVRMDGAGLSIVEGKKCPKGSFPMGRLTINVRASDGSWVLSARVAGGQSQTNVAILPAADRTLG